MTWRDRLEQGAAVALSVGLGLVAGLWLTACTAGRSSGAPPPAEPRTGAGPDASGAASPDAAAPRAAPRPGPDAGAPPPAMVRRRAVERRQPLPRNYVE